MSTIIIPNFLTEKVVVGLNNYQYTVVNAGMHVARIRLSKHPASSLTCVINLNGSPQASLTVQPVSGEGGQSEQVLSVTMNCSPSDIIAFNLTSSASSDQQLNNVKATLNVHQGSSN